MRIAFGSPRSILLSRSSPFEERLRLSSLFEERLVGERRGMFGVRTETAGETRRTEEFGLQK